MSRYTDAVCKLCRREGAKLFLKGERCYTEKCSLTRRSYAPGQHGMQRKKMSEYGVQLREKQKVKRYYGMQEVQFKRTFVVAAKQRGITGENLLRILETRLDNVIFRVGLGASRSESRQLVTHGHFLINEKKVNIPSYKIKVGDFITLCEKSKQTSKFKDRLEEISKKNLPKWISFDTNNNSWSIVSLPSREDIDADFAEHFIVELYSK